MGVRIALLVAVLALLPLGVSAREVPTCNVTPASVVLSYPQRTGYYVSASVPVNTVVYSRVSGAGAPSNEWTAIPQSGKGSVNTAFVTTLFTQPGDVALQIIDFRKGDSNNVIATCGFTVLP